MSIALSNFFTELLAHRFSEASFSIDKSPKSDYNTRPFFPKNGRLCKMARMNKRIIAGLKRMGREDSRYDALYRRVYAAFGLAPCATWVLYFLLASEDGLTQHEIADMMMFPKQTVNSAVARLAKDGMVEFFAAEGSRKEKRIRLTATGRDYADQTVNRLLQAEIRATQKFGEKKMDALSDLRAEYLNLLKSEFERDFLGDSDG